MPKLSQLTSENTYQTLPDSFFTHHTPSALANPKLVIASQSTADVLGLEYASLNGGSDLAVLSCAHVPEQWQPLAMKYFGHQFGYLNPELGDGRGLVMAQVRSPKGELWDLHLKGSGTTAYSRGGDGRAVLRSSIREFLASEALSALNIPSTRALAVVTSDTPVYRETEERGAALLRVARSHIRFGHFEFAYHSKQPALTQALANYVINQHFPCLEKNAAGYADMFRMICVNTANMIMEWQTIGFSHGVMNTDNMSIIGDTFDFGPYGFMDRFRANYICNHSDDQGRYAFDRQPAIAQWNLSVLAQALSPLVDNDKLSAGLQAYSETFNHGFIERMGAKLGFAKSEDGDNELIFETLTMLQRARLDYSIFFRAISHEDLEQNMRALRDRSVDILGFDQWSLRYRARLEKEDISGQRRAANMQQRNPKYILRNHLAQQAIAAAEQEDFSVLHRLHECLLRPFEEQQAFGDLANWPPEEAEELEISCSS